MEVKIQTKGDELHVSHPGADLRTVSQYKSLGGKFVDGTHWVFPKSLKPAITLIEESRLARAAEETKADESAKPTSKK